MKFLCASIFLLLFSVSVHSYTDESHYSKTFDTTRFFRVFTPLNYDAENLNKRYNVIYYFHGCGGSYRKSGTYSYQDFGLIPPKADNRPDDPDYELPNNADFENEATRSDVIIIAVDGKIPGIPGCGVYFPSQVDDWSGNRYNFSVYIRELIDVVDSRYNTLAGAQHRAISGLSMGGQAATWVAATNPHLFSSASEFCYSPAYYDVGELSYLTTVDIQQLWRNFRGLPMRHSTNTKDWLKYYTTQLYQTYLGAGFKNEYYLADYCKHHAARIDLQFDFHSNHFSDPKQAVDCFSFINLYPDFEVWGYEVSSKKKGNGWIYLHDVTKNGFGIYTRERLTWGKSLINFDISVTTPAVYQPNKKYTFSRYSYKKGTITTEPIVANGEGKMVINSIGGVGEEIGIEGEGLQPPVMVLTDTINENLYLYENAIKSFAFDVVNLSTATQTIDFVVSTENKELLTIVSQPGQVVIPALSKLTIDSFFTCKGNYLPDFRNTGFIKINTVIDGVVQDREHFRKVVVKEVTQVTGNFKVKVFDGQSEELALYQYQWNQWDNPFSTEAITEGSGNGNGKPELGEIFSIWIQTPSPLEAKDLATWHPVIPLNGREHPDVCVDEIKQRRMNTGRSTLSAQISLNRKPTKKNPVRIPVQVEFLQAEYMENDCHRNTADKYGYAYYDLIMLADGAIQLTKSAN
ncbi:alpha/beta hydrolase-fold protein [Reichenbachiella sp. MALMAid0571]|uniref:alpha/beta hydrolase n=1 Tax=Reichenbachiella sp. MALMAid0571 TaxID=3143939 RepID=UPI0032E050B4